MNTRITRTSTKGLHIVYDSQLSAIAQLNISWNNGLGGGVAMSIQQAEELQFLLSEVLRLASPAIDPTKEKAAAAVEAQLLPWRDRLPAFAPVRSHPPTTTRAMSNPYRNALAELHVAIQLYTGLNPAAADVCPAELVRRLMDAMAASAALLAQPELPELPELTDEEIDDWCGECSDLTRAGEADHYWVFGDVQGSDINAIVRAAIARWGCPTPPPRKP